MAETLVTNGMRLSPPEPSMLDMRNSILAAEQANGGGLHDEVWEVFRVRGMGYRAAVVRRQRHRAGRGFLRRRRTPPARRGPRRAS